MTPDSTSSETTDRSDDEIMIVIDREMYETLRSQGFYSGEDAHGTRVHITEDYRTVGSIKTKDESPAPGAWEPLFPIEDDDEIPGTKPKHDSDSKTTMLEAVPNDTIQITAVHAGMHTIPEKLRVVWRTNTYCGPVLRLAPTEEWDGEDTSYELTCPDRYSHLVLWRAVTDADDFVQSFTKVARVSAEIFNVSGYDICEGCGEPITDPMHRGLAMMGQCNGQFRGGEEDE